MQLLIGQQLHATVEMFFQHFEGKRISGFFIGRDVIEGFLKAETIHRLRTVGVKTVDEIGHALLSYGTLQTWFMPNDAKYRDRGTGGIAFNDEADAVRQRNVRQPAGAERDGQFRQRGTRPFG